MLSREERQDLQTCRDHHGVLCALIERFPAQLPFSADETAALLANFKAVLLRHLELEDKWMYPHLQASADAKLAEKAKRFQAEMGDLRTRFGTFAERWGAAPEIERAPEDFLRDWSALRELLERRIAAEDDDLYESAERAL